MTLFCTATSGAQFLFCQQMPDIADRNSAVIQGRVSDDAGQPVRGAIIAAQRRFPPPVDAGSVLVTTQSSSSGSYRITGLPPGTYWICAQMPGTVYLDPCQWQTAPPSRNAAAGTLGVVDLRLERGGFVYMSIDDPEQALRKNPKTTAVRTGVVSRLGMLLDAHWISETDKSKVARIAVPFDRDVSLVAMAAGVDLVDNDGKPANNGHDSMKVKLKKDDSARVIRLKLKLKDDKDKSK